MKQVLRVLVVEEDDQTLIALAMQLIRREHKVEAANDMSQAIRLLNQKHFDLLFSNAPIEEGHGWELVRHACSSKPYAVALSRAEESQSLATSVAWMIDARLVKPFTTHELDILLNQVMAT